MLAFRLPFCFLLLLSSCFVGCCTAGTYAVVCEATTLCSFSLNLCVCWEKKCCQVHVCCSPTSRPHPTLGLQSGVFCAVLTCKHAPHSTQIVSLTVAVSCHHPAYLYKIKEKYHLYTQIIHPLLCCATHKESSSFVSKNLRDIRDPGLVTICALHGTACGSRNCSCKQPSMDPNISAA